MLIPRVATRYAKSVLQLAIELGQLEEVRRDMELVKKTCRENKELEVMLKSPVVKTDKKIRIFETIFKSNLTDLSVKFFNIVIRKNRAGLIPDVAAAFVSQYKDHKNISIVTIETATAMSADSKAKMQAFLNNAVKNDVEMVEKVNPALIGGLVLRIEDQQIDASVRSNIAKLKREFSKDLYTTKY